MKRKRMEDSQSNPEPTEVEEEYPTYQIFAFHSGGKKKGVNYKLSMKIDGTAEEIRLVLTDCNDRNKTETFTLADKKTELFPQFNALVVNTKEEGKLHLFFEMEEEAKAVSTALQRKEINYDDIKKSFGAKLEEGPFYGKLEHYLSACVDQWVHGKLLAPIGTILQSSGHGKSKSMEWFSQKNITVFICLREIGAGGFPPRSKIADLFLSSMEYQADANRFIAALIRASLETVHVIKEGKQADIPKAFYSSQPWGTSDSKDAEMEKFVERVEYRFSEKGEEMTSNEDISKEYRATLHETPLHVFVDEAASLLRDSNEPDPIVKDKKINQFRVMRRAVKELCKKLPIVFVLADTNGKMYEFVRSLRNLTSSERIGQESELGIKEPFFKIWYVDLLVPKDDINRFKGDPTNLYDYIKNRDPEKTLFLYGRPLWSSTKDALNLAKSKLICADSWSVVQEEDKLLGTLALLSVRTTLSFHGNFIYGKELVKRYMSTLCKIDGKLEHYDTHYVSEPILAESAAQIMRETNTLKDVISNLSNFLQFAPFNISGSIGEIAAQLVLLFAFDKVHDNEGNILYSQSITVSQFLNSLVGPDNAKMILDTLKPSFKEGLLYCTHFIKKIDNLIYEDFGLDFLPRCAAVHLKDYAEGNDMVFPVLLSEGKFGCIVIQVKNRSEISKSELVAAAEKAVPDFNFCEGSSEDDKKKWKLDKNFLSLTMSLGLESDDRSLMIEPVKTILQRETTNNVLVTTTNFILRGLNVYDCLKPEIVEPLRRIIHCGRRNLDLPAEPDVVEGVFKASMSTTKLAELASNQH